MLDQKIVQEIDAMFPELQAQRRDFHRYAEVGWCEIRTSSIIARKLTDWGFDEVLVGKDVCDADTRMGLPSQEFLDANYERALAEGADPEFAEKAKDGFTGVIGILHCGEGPTVAMRFDIDALPFSEATDEKHRPAREGFGSCNDEMMHACGHDGHATIGLGVAKTLLGMRDQLHGSIKLIFQPSEEGVRGAYSIVQKGHLDGVDYCFANHMAGGPGAEFKGIGVGSGESLATVKLDVEYHGVTSHAAVAPEKGSNALLAAAACIQNLHSIPRYSDQMTRVNVGKLVAGNARNIICDNAHMELEVRGGTTEANDFMEEYALRVIKGAAEMHGCTYEIKRMGGAASTGNSPELMDYVVKVMEENNIPVMRLSGGAAGSEDYSYFAKRVIDNGGQSCYFMNMTDIAAPVHNRYMDITDETALCTGVKAFVALVDDLLGTK